MKKEVYIIGRSTCHSNPQILGYIRANWKDETGNGGVYHPPPSADGSFRLVVPPNTSGKIMSTTRAATWRQVVQTPSTPGEVLGLGTNKLRANDAIGE